MLTVQEVAWVERAVSKDGGRMILTKGAILYHEGDAVLVATDTHRLHVLRLGAVEKEFPVISIDLKRVLLEARFAKATHVTIRKDFTEVHVGKMYKGEFQTTKIYAPVLSAGDGYPFIARVIPTTKRPVSEFFAINCKYLADATLLARSENGKTIMYSEDASCRPILFRPAGDRWFAVVMPMNLNGWTEDAK
jgi:DNA polymerase III sliding clamp (beta) subunit (PCNA family)